MTESRNKNSTKIAQKRGKPKGLPKTGGREKGTPNRASLYVRQELDKAGLNLVREYLKEIDNLPPGEARMQALQWLFQFVFPRLKEIEGPDDKPELPPPPPALPALVPQPAAQQPTSTAPQGRDERKRIIHGIAARTPEPSAERQEVPPPEEAEPDQSGE